MYGRPDIEFHTEYEADRDEKIVTVDGENGTCALSLRNTDTGLDIRAFDPTGTVRISNGAHLLPVPPVGANPAAEHITPQATPETVARAVERIDRGAPRDNTWDGAPGVPPADLAALRAENESLRAKLTAYEQGEAGAWVLYDGQEYPDDPDLDASDGGWPHPVCVVIGTIDDAQAEADQWNLKRISTDGHLAPARVVRIAVTDAKGERIENGLPIVWCRR